MAWKDYEDLVEEFPGYKVKGGDVYASDGKTKIGYVVGGKDIRITEHGPHHGELYHME